LCRAEVAVIVFAGNKKLYEFASSDIKDVLYRYTQVRQLSIGMKLIGGRLLRHMNIEDQKISRIKRMPIPTIPMMVEQICPLTIINGLCRTLHNPMEPHNSRLRCITDERATTRLSLIDDSLCSIISELPNLCLIGLLLCIRDTDLRT